jgi:membrane fusion protein, multidrug efflux system
VRLVVKKQKAQAMSKTGWALALVVGLLAAGGGAWAVWGRDGAPKEEKKAEDKPLQFTAAEVTRPVLGAMAQQIEFSGALVAPQSAVLRAKVGGTVTRLAVAEGDRVQAGQMLARIDAADMASRLAERAAMVAQANVTLAQAERTHANNQQLAQQQFLSPNAVEQSKTALDAARAQAQAMRAQQDTMRVATRDTVLTAPFAGIVAKRSVVTGEKVSPEQALFTVVNITQLELAGQVGTHEVSLLAAGQPVTLRVEGWPEPVSGKVARIAPMAEAGSRAIGVAVLVPNRDERLRAGQFAVAAVAVPDTVQRLTVPQIAVVQAGGQDAVWVIDKGALTRRVVTLGRSDAKTGRVEITQGLTAQAQLLAVRFENLKDGAKAIIGIAPALAAASSASKAQ